MKNSTIVDPGEIVEERANIKEKISALHENLWVKTYHL